MNFENICRTCSLEGNLSSLFTKFTTSEGNSFFISDMLYEIIEIKAIKNDNYPQNICNSCLDKLKSAYYFKKQCLDVNENFEKYFKTNENNLVDSIKVENLSNDDEFLKSPLVYVSVKNENMTDLETQSNIQVIKNEGISIEQPHFELIIKDEIFEETYSAVDQSDNQINLFQPIRKNHFSCDLCDKSFKRKTNLIIHERIHSGERSFSCKFCNKSFSILGNLQRHRRIHTGEKPYSCDVCSKKFNQKTSLNRHKRTHTGDRPYSCDICYKTFSQQYLVIEHKRIHTGEKPYSCDICLKTFTKRSTLRQHKFSHTTEKLFSCHICDRTFNQKRCLNKHMEIHNEDKSFSCDICNKTFRNTNNLVRHKYTHNGKELFS